MVKRSRSLAVVSAASLVFMLTADVASAQVGGGGRGPTLGGRNRNSAAVQWWSRSFGPNTRIRRFADGRNVATGRPIVSSRAVPTTTPRRVTATPSRPLPSTTRVAPGRVGQATFVAPDPPAILPAGATTELGAGQGETVVQADAAEPVGEAEPATPPGIDPARYEAIRRQLGPNARIISIGGVPVN
ncbi:MAG: hypothetical protein AAF532_04660 [Planctomycetota bacterium]